MIPCPVCGGEFEARGKRLYCSPACTAAAYRRRKRVKEPLVVPPARPRKGVTVYECDCGARAAGRQRCDECGVFMRRVGLGGACPHCDEPVTVAELLGDEAAAG